MLLDTGAPCSFVWRPFLKLLKGDSESSSSLVEKMICNIEGEKVTLNITDYSYPDSRLHVINLLGTDFLNEFVVIDDFSGQRCVKLKAYKKEFPNEMNWK